jgi:hypothetical protein
MKRTKIIQLNNWTGRNELVFHKQTAWWFMQFSIDALLGNWFNSYSLRPKIFAPFDFYTSHFE